MQLWNLRIKNASREQFLIDWYNMQRYFALIGDAREVNFWRRIPMSPRKNDCNRYN